ncbi:kinase-like domain-containing protein [Suillus subaureus]|uniref:non-specific serine/threonine protein kinase n=1 Tax=Suillus subaureus TaxID=48587 RepID=A0A9P7JF76_9AGAM|nr:kinase-like domain-containing protein [Suillus subaureus]KAG1818704.1 kinase-like domain-containing protein [Suillus subaureus]
MFVVANSLRSALRKTLGRTLPRFASTSTSPTRDSIKRPLDDPFVRVQINDKDDGEEFVCDEEPLHFGEGKLEIIRKLGWVGNSNVWLARSLGFLQLTPPQVWCKDFYCEVDSLRTIKTANPDHPGHQHCLHLYDVIAEKSCHGPHICIVTNILGANMIVKQTLLALDYLHRECSFVHTDVKPDNILVSHLSPEPIITVKLQLLPNFGLWEDASNLKVCLIDYATPAKEHRVELVQPVLLWAPEVTLGHGWSAPIDVWSMGCLVFEYLTGAAMFQLSESSSISVENLSLQRILEHIGPFPPSFLERCQHWSDFFDERGSLRIHNLIPQAMESCLRAYKVMDEKDIAPAAVFIRRCLTIDPHARPTALELLDDEWLKNCETAAWISGASALLGCSSGMSNRKSETQKNAIGETDDT